MTLTPLEQEVLRAFEAEFGGIGFPPPEAFMVTGRENTGAGRFTDLVSEAQVSHKGPCGLSAIIQMDGLQHGLGALVFLSEGKPDALELHLWGDDAWDGVERPWKIVPRAEETHA